jgi:tetratricopeptide (TPR) repeat protein
MLIPDRTAWLVVAIALIASSGAAEAIVALPGPATPAVLEAQKLAAEGREADADMHLQTALSGCAAGPVGQSCRAQLGFAAATLAEDRAARDTGGRAQWLRTALARYEGVLAESPTHAPALAGCVRVWIAQGDRGKAQALLEDTLKRAPDQEAVALMLGDVARDAKDWDRAIRAYRQAADQHPTSDPARRRLVQAYIGLLPARLDDLRQTLAEVESQFPVIAELGHRAIIERFNTASDQSVAEASLLRLVLVLAATRRLTVENLATLPAGWMSPALRDLRAYVTAPDRQPPSGWWRNASARRHVLATGGLALGNQALLANDVAGAAARWEIAATVAPEFDEYAFDSSLKGLPTVRLDLQTALALHYFRFPALDPGEVKFNRVIDSIFNSKAEAYKLSDLESIQRHHTILGVIYAEKGQWKSTAFAKNAIFQLDNALKTAARRDQRDGSYQPLPELRERLAKGLDSTGDKARAATTYLAAAEGYLDTDALEAVKGALAPAFGLTAAGGSEHDHAVQVQSVLLTRRQIEYATGSALDPAASTYEFKSGGAHAWLYGTALPHLASDFLDRQRFKALSDLAAHLQAAGHAAAATELAARAFSSAIEHVRHLTGPADLVRLEQIRPLAVQDRVLDRKPLVQGQFTSSASGFKTWKLTDPITLRSTEVRLDGDDVLAARIARELAGDAGLASTGFVVQGGQVTVREGAGSSEAVTRIQRMPGVSVVHRAPATTLTTLPGPSYPALRK